MITVSPDQINIRFLGVYDLVTTIGDIAGHSGSLIETLPKGVGHVAHAVALSEEREKFEFTAIWIGVAASAVVGKSGRH